MAFNNSVRFRFARRRLLQLRHAFRDQVLERRFILVSRLEDPDDRGDVLLDHVLGGARVWIRRPSPCTRSCGPPRIRSRGWGVGSRRCHAPSRPVRAARVRRTARPAGPPRPRRSQWRRGRGVRVHGDALPGRQQRRKRLRLDANAAQRGRHEDGTTSSRSAPPPPDEAIAIKLADDSAQRRHRSPWPRWCWRRSRTRAWHSAH